MTSYNKMRRYYFRMLDRFLEQCNVPKEVRTDYRREIHYGIKNELEVESIARTKITDEEMWVFVHDAQILLITEYGYLADDDNELKFS